MRCQILSHGLCALWQAFFDGSCNMFFDVSVRNARLSIDQVRDMFASMW